MVSGHLREKKDYYYMVLSVYDEEGARRQKWIATGLPVKNNKKKAEDLLYETRKTYATARFPVFLENHEMRRIHFHDLRHSCASLLLANDVSLKQIQEWLGHSTFKLTADTYTHLKVDSKVMSSAALSDSFFAVKDEK